MTPAGNPPPLPRQVPERLGGYAVGKPLGCGATGWVFQATRADGARFALKLIHPHLADSLLEQLLAEARLSERLRSEHTVRVFASGEENGHIYSVMELVEGRSLAELLRERGKLDRESAHRIALGIARGLADLHAAGVAHRDVKPSNVLLGDDGRVVLSDFGIAAEVRADASTSSLDFAGSLAYAAPEQAAQRWDFRSDIYGFGATLVHMLSGSPPERHGLLASLPRGFGRTLTDQLANTDPGLSDVAKRCLATAPSQRFQTADELLQALDQLGLGSGLDRTMRNVRFFWRRNLSRFLNVFARPAVAVGALAAALAVAGGLAYLLFRNSDEPATCQVTAPVNVRAEQGATGEVVLTWQRTDSCAPSGYQVAWSTRNDRSGVPASQVKDAQVFDGRREVRISLPGLSVGTPYYLWVEAYGPDKRPIAAPHLEIVPGITCDKAPPPTGLEMDNANATSVRLHWKTGGGCTTGFYVYYGDTNDYRAVGSGARVTDGVLDVSETDFTVSGLATGKHYWFWVYAYGPGDTQSRTFAGPVDAILYPQQSEPALLVSPPPGSTLPAGAVEFRWTPGRNVTSYNIWVSGIGPGRAEILNRASGPELSALVDALPTDGRTVYVRLTATDRTEGGTFIRDYTFTAADGGEPRLVRTFDLPGTSAGWYDTGIAFEAGDQLEVAATGLITNSPEDRTGYTADGRDSCDSPVTLVSGLPCMALLGQYLGVPPFVLGQRKRLIADRQGRLFVGINDSEHRDNGGAWTITVRVTR